MSDLIDRKAALASLVKEYNRRFELGEREGLRLAWIEKAIDDVPAARARWEYVDYGGVGNWHCSACRAISHKRTNFCPTCGRDMRGDYQ